MQENRFSLEGRVAVVTGASKGIGEAIARGLAQQGANVVVSSRKQQACEAVAKDIGTGAIGIAAHMGDSDAIAHLVDASVEAFGGIDIIVNNAATNPVFGGVVDADLRAFDKILDVNLKGPYELAKRAHPYLVKSGHASVINISSIGGLSPEPGLGMYSVSKAALISLTKVMAKEWGAENIRANVICPGLVKTKFSQPLWSNADVLAEVVGNQPLNRAANPDEMAGLAVFLASDASSYCTGGVYVADGGHSL